MNLLRILWLTSLVIECGVLIGILNTSWRRTFPRFLAFLVFDVLSGMIAFWVAAEAPAFYDIFQRLKHIVLVVWLVAMVTESYRRLVPSVRLWGFEDGFAYPLAAGGTLAFHAAMVRPFRWPASYLEGVWLSIGASRCILGLIMVCVIMLATRRQTESGYQSAHARILCLYLLATSTCYYLAPKIPQDIGLITMSVSTICYTAWLWIVWRSYRPTSPAVPELSVVGQFGPVGLDPTSGGVL